MHVVILACDSYSRFGVEAGLPKELNSRILPTWTQAGSRWSQRIIFSK